MGLIQTHAAYENNFKQIWQSILSCGSGIFFISLKRALNEKKKKKDYLAPREIYFTIKLSAWKHKSIVLDLLQASV